MQPPRTPALAVDLVIELEDRPGSPIVLIQRRFPPLGWALPGGFVEVGESVAEAARREAREETALAVRLTALLGVYSDPRRDPRLHVVSVAFAAVARGTPHARDDARHLDLFSLEALPPLAFDHARILDDFRRWREGGRSPCAF